MGFRPILSDDEKKRRGTFREDRTEAALVERQASKIVNGPWLETIPPPVMPLGKVGLDKYRELSTLLHSQNKLTTVTQMQAEVAARQYEKVYTISVAGGQPSASDITQLQRALDSLRIAENAAPISNPAGRINKFTGSGFANRLPKTRALR